MHGGWKLFSPTLLVEMKKSLLKRWVALYALARVWRREKRKKYMRVLARQAGLSRAGRDEVMRSDGHERTMCV
jgi:hypothetical protein